MSRYDAAGVCFFREFEAYCLTKVSKRRIIN